MSQERDTFSKTERNYIGKARTIIRHKPDLVPYVLNAAMSVAMMYPEAEDGGKGGRGKKSEIISQFSSRYLQQARAVLQYLPETAEIVKNGGVPLAEAAHRMHTKYHN